MDKLKKSWSWLAASSANSENWSLTLKAGIPAVVLVAGYFGLNIDAIELENLSDIVVKLPAEFVTLCTSLAAVYGLIRKIINSFRKHKLE